MDGTRLAAERPEGQKTVVWRLDTDGWRNEKWDTITSADLSEQDLSRQGWEVAQILQAEKRAAREAALNAGEEERTEREVMQWAGRPKGVSTPLERLHLNTRRARNRPEKEQRRVSHEQARREAEEMARKVLAAEAEGR